jgi:branched-chain amino acid transport system substrate-binding protein
MFSAKRLALGAVLVLSALFVLVACGGAAATQPPAPTSAPSVATSAPSAPTSAPSAQVLKVGVGGPYTGPAALTGTEFKNSVTMALDNVNSQVGNYKIQVVWIDEQSDPQKSTQAYEEAIVGQGIQVGILNWHSSDAVAMMEVSAKHQVPYLFGLGATEVVNQKFQSDPKYQYWMTKGWPSPAKLEPPYVTALNDAVTAGTLKLPNKKVALWGEDTDWGHSVAKAMRAEFEKTGWTVASEDYFDIKQTDFSSLMQRYKDQGVAVLAGTSTAAPVISAFIKATDDAGLKSLVIADGLGWFGDWYKLTGKASDYVVDEIPGWTTDKAKKFAADYKQRWGSDPSPSASGLAYDYTGYFIKILQETLKDKGTLNSQTIYDEVKEKVWTGQLTYTDGIVMKNYEYSKDSIPDPVIGKDAFIFPVLQYKGGQSTVVWPTDWATGKLVNKP